jgi:PKD repeat protein
MKQLCMIFLVLFVIAISCQKSSVSTNEAKPNPTNNNVTAVAAAPTAGFKISNAANPSAVWVALPLVFENTSQNAQSYLWDFGDGTTSTQKIPGNVYYGICGMSYTITLTATNSQGQSATYTSPYTVYCSRGMNISGALPHPYHD